MKKTLLAVNVLMLMLVLVLAPFSSADAAYTMDLNSVSPNSGQPGSMVRLAGNKFGAVQAGHRVILRHESGSYREMAVTRWGNTGIDVAIPSDAKTGANTIFIANPPTQPGRTDASRPVAFTIPVMLKPGIAAAIGNAGPGVGLPAGTKTPQLQMKAVGCPDPAITELRVGWPAKNPDGTYTFRVVAIVTNVGQAPFESARRQTGITLKEGPRVLSSGVWPSRMAETIALARGEAFSQVATVTRWSPTSEFLTDFTAELSYDPDIRMDSNPKNDDCGAGNNRKVLTVAEVRRQLGIAP
jgi:hypothetical protein